MSADLGDVERGRDPALRTDEIARGADVALFAVDKWDRMRLQTLRAVHEHLVRCDKPNRVFDLRSHGRLHLGQGWLAADYLTSLKL